MTPSQKAQQIEIPLLLKKLKTYKGFPIPRTVLIAENGIPDFRVTDLEKWKKVVDKKLCGLCGTALHKHIFFIGGQGSCESQYFFDPPMHKQCAEYAMRVCPFIVGSKDYASIPAVQHIHPDTILRVTNQKTPQKMGLYECTGYLKVWEETQGFFLIAMSPLSVTYQERPLV